MISVTVTIEREHTTAARLKAKRYCMKTVGNNGAKFVNAWRKLFRLSRRFKTRS